MPRYRCDTSRTQPDGAILHYAQWMGGPTLAKIEKCQINLKGVSPRTVTITGEPDSLWSIPAECRIMGKHVKGYVTVDHANMVFRHQYF